MNEESGSALMLFGSKIPFNGVDPVSDLFSGFGVAADAAGFSDVFVAWLPMHHLQVPVMNDVATTTPLTRPLHSAHGS